MKPPSRLQMRIWAVVTTGFILLIAVLAAIHPAKAAPGDGLPPASPTPIPTASGTPVLFVAAHPDDDTLAMSVAIAEHSGQNIHVLILTYGEASQAIHQLNGLAYSTWWGGWHTPATEGYAPLTQADFAAARQVEGIRAVAALTAPNAVLHWAGLPDGGLTTASAKAAILSVANSITSGPVRIKGHTYISAVEPHPDHRAVGNAMLELAAQDPARFSDRRFYVLPHSWGYTGSLPGKAFDLPNDATIAARVADASAVYADWSPPYAYAIGMHSTAGYFQALNADPKSMVHK